MNPPIADNMGVRRASLEFDLPVKCAFQGCNVRFVPQGPARLAYQRKGYCYCPSCQPRMAAYFRAKQMTRIA